MNQSIKHLQMPNISHVPADGFSHPTMPDINNLPAGTFLREREARYYAGKISKSTLRRWISSNKLPPPRRLTERTLVWTAGELREALQKLAQPNQTDSQTQVAA